VAHRPGRRARRHSGLAVTALIRPPTVAICHHRPSPQYGILPFAIELPGFILFGDSPNLHFFIAHKFHPGIYQTDFYTSAPSKHRTRSCRPVALSTVYWRGLRAWPVLGLALKGFYTVGSASIARRRDRVKRFRSRWSGP
jgi:hypothetical protein